MRSMRRSIRWRWSSHGAALRPGPRCARRSSPATRPRCRNRALTGGAPWILVPCVERDALVAFRADHPLLAERYAIQLGVKTGANEVFLDPEEPIEASLLRRAVRGRDIRAFRTAGTTRLLWTHDAQGRPLQRLPPQAAAYLARYSATLRSRTDYAGGPEWTLFRTSGAVAPHRVVWSDLARRLEAAALSGPGERDRVPLNSCYLLGCKGEEEALALAAWLNSSWCRAAARMSATAARGGFARFDARTIGGLPFVISALEDPSLDRAGPPGLERRRCPGVSRRALRCPPGSAAPCPRRAAPTGRHHHASWLRRCASSTDPLASLLDPPAPAPAPAVARAIVAALTAAESAAASGRLAAAVAAAELPAGPGGAGPAWRRAAGRSGRRGQDVRGPRGGSGTRTARDGGDRARRPARSVAAHRAQAWRADPASLPRTLLSRPVAGRRNARWWWWTRVTGSAMPRPAVTGIWRPGSWVGGCCWSVRRPWSTASMTSPPSCFSR